MRSKIAPHVTALGRIEIERGRVPPLRLENRPEQERPEPHLNRGFARERPNPHRCRIGIGRGKFEPEIKTGSMHLGGPWLALGGLPFRELINGRRRRIPAPPQVRKSARRTRKRLRGGPSRHCYSFSAWAGIPCQSPSAGSITPPSDVSRPPPKAAVDLLAANRCPGGAQRTRSAAKSYAASASIAALVAVSPNPCTPTQFWWRSLRGPSRFRAWRSSW